MKRSIKLASAFLLAVAAIDLASIATAEARGGGPPNLSNWAGYQRRLDESRGQTSATQPYTTPPSAYPGKKWKKRGKRK